MRNSCTFCFAVCLPYLKSMLASFLCWFYFNLEDFCTKLSGRDLSGYFFSCLVSPRGSFESGRCAPLTSAPPPDPGWQIKAIFILMGEIACQFNTAHTSGQNCSSQFMGGNYNVGMASLVGTMRTRLERISFGLTKAFGLVRRFRQGCLPSQGKPIANRSSHGFQKTADFAKCKT
jgi:hypothetical protein